MAQTLYVSAMLQVTYFKAILYHDCLSRRPSESSYHYFTFLGYLLMPLVSAVTTLPGDSDNMLSNAKYVQDKNQEMLEGIKTLLSRISWLFTFLCLSPA